LQTNSRRLSHDHTYLIVDGAAELMEFLKKAFDAKEMGEAMKTPDAQFATQKCKSETLD